MVMVSLQHVASSEELCDWKQGLGLVNFEKKHSVIAT